MKRLHPRKEILKASYLLADRETLEQKIETADTILKHCTLCPHKCGIDRSNGERGRCKQGKYSAISSAIPHFGEEPYLTGTGGSGTIFFYGCTLSCKFCQNFTISTNRGSEISDGELAEQFLKLQKNGVHNINLVTPTPHIPSILHAILLARDGGLTLPIAYNTNSYIPMETLNLLDGVVDIYMPDLKYSSNEVAERYSGIKNYTDIARNAICEMYRQRPRFLTKDGLLQKGCSVRILLLPMRAEGAKDSIDFLVENRIKNVALSIMTQYSPLHRAKEYPELDQALDPNYGEEILNYAAEKGFAELLYQSKGAAEQFIPDFQKSDPFSQNNRSIQ